MEHVLLWLLQFYIILLTLSNCVIFCSENLTSNASISRITNNSLHKNSTLVKLNRHTWGIRSWNRLKWGFATSAYQIEGAWNIDGRGPSIWDTFAKQRLVIADESDGDTACDSYHKWEEDVDLMATLHAQVYRFSISWSRLLRNGRKDSFDPKGAGVQYYNALLNELVAKGIEPIVTLNHFDLPQALEDEGGFLNATLIVNTFADYADIAFATFGDRVKNWVTFNNPWLICFHGYQTGLYAPGRMEKDPKKGSLLCGHNLLKAHATAYRLYQKKYQEKQGGRIGLSLFAPWFDKFPIVTDEIWAQMREDKANNKTSWGYFERDEHAAELARQEVIGWFAQPVMRGSYPTALNELYGKEKVHNFSKNWVTMINGSVDFLGINHYRTYRVSNASWHKDVNKTVFHTYDPTRRPEKYKLAYNWVRTDHVGFRSLLVWLKREYNNPTIYVTENGFNYTGYRVPGRPDPTARQITLDLDRVKYFMSYIDQLKLAVTEDLVDVQVYTVWSLLDSFEWLKGFTEKFGIFYVDFASANLTRIPHGSACFLEWSFHYNRTSELPPEQRLPYTKYCPGNFPEIILNFLEPDVDPPTRMEEYEAMADTMPGWMLPFTWFTVGVMYTYLIYLFPITLVAICLAFLCGSFGDEPW